MKYFFRVLIVLVLAVAVVAGVYYRTTGRPLPFEASTVKHITASRPQATEKYASRTLIAELKDEDFRLYKSGRSVILEHGKNEFTYENWSSVIASEAPQLYYHDFDGDGENELIVRAVSGEDETTGEYVYELYVLNPLDTKKEDYSVLLISQDSWRTVLNEALTEELSQLKSCKKVLQFAMAIRSKGITYDDETGLVKEAGYVGYARALQGSDGKYLTLTGWTKSKGIFNVTQDNEITADVEVVANYDETYNVQQLGKIHFGIQITPENKIALTKKSMSFEAEKQYRVSDPTEKAKKSWTYTKNNSFKPDSSGEIQYAKHTAKPRASVITETEDLSAEETDIKYVRALAFSERSVTLTACEGYTFSRDAADRGDYSVTINAGTDGEYEISYTAEISADGKKLTINFDRSYGEKDIKTVTVSYGAK